MMPNYYTHQVHELEITGVFFVNTIASMGCDIFKFEIADWSTPSW